MPSTFQTRTSMAQSARSERPRGSEPVNSVFVVLLRLRSPPRSLVQPVPLTRASPVGGADPKARPLPGLAPLLTAGPRRAAPSRATGCTPALSGQTQGAQAEAVPSSPCLRKHRCQSLASGPSGYK